MSVLCTDADIGGLRYTYRYGSYFHLLMYFSTQSMDCCLMRKLRKGVVCTVEENLGACVEYDVVPTGLYVLTTVAHRQVVKVCNSLH
jgi:hypothetical protein